MSKPRTWNTGASSDALNLQEYLNQFDDDELDQIIQRISQIPKLSTGSTINSLKNANTKALKIRAINQIINSGDYQIGDIGIAGLGLKRRRGRPRGSGIKISVPKIPNFIGFGINEINQKQLNNGILKIRRNTKSNYMDMPSKHISKNLQGIIKTMIGGGVPKYEDLGKLDNDEKEYLNKIVSRSNMSDKLSVPAPSKDQQEKDIHNFEVMKGEIMSGNDSVELVKKFKLLIRKLAKQGLLPKNDVDDLMDTLLDIGY